jgi:HD-like signal output (HDOD) protein
MHPPSEYADILKRLNGLPPFPTTALRLLSISTESETAIEDYLNAYKSDPALAADLLQAANSLEFGLVARVDSIRQALTLLGLDRVSSLSVTIAMMHYIREAPRLRIMRPLWSHSIATAVIAETLGSARSSSGPGLYTAGLVHDVGRLGLLMATENRYAKLLAQPVAGLEEAAAMEREQFGLTHAEAGAIMGRSWGFPVLLCNAILYHHEAEGQPADERLRLVQLACQFASALGYVEHGYGPRSASLGGLELPPDLRGCAALEPERLRKQITNLLFRMSGPA